MHQRGIIVAVIVAATAPQLAAAQHFTRAERIRHVAAPMALDTTGRFQSTIAQLGDDIFIGGQPTELGLRELRAKGVTTVVNLRTPEEMQRSVKFDEQALVAQLGMKYVYIPMRGNAEFPYSPQAVTRFAQAVRDANGKVLLHCTIGWRASHLWAAYLIADRGVAVDSALDNARAINLMADHHMSEGRQPVEDFLDRDLPMLGRPHR
jgi:uncharacterized protein (TIGR01244 family)